MLNRPLAIITGNLLFCLSVTAASNNPSPAREEVQRFSDTLSLINDYYVTPIKNQALFDNAIQGMLNGLDPQSGIVDRELPEVKDFVDNKTAEPGLEITFEKGILKVITPLLNTSAFKAGIRPGDYIIKIGSHSTQGLSLEQAMRFLRGKEGESLDLVILRRGATKPLGFKVICERLSSQSVKSRLFEGQYAYISISKFKQNTAKDVKTALLELQQQAGGKLRGLVLDLRYNPGGMLSSAVEVADTFLDNRTKNKQMVIVRARGRLSNLNYTAIATPGDFLQQAPVIVLINNGSASAAEVVAGALKDYKRAVVLGTKSFGKGSVQSVLPLNEKYAIKITTALYFTPSGSSIQDKGIVPDIAIEALSIPRSGKNETQPFSEADLKDHLLEAGTKSASTVKNTNADDTQALLNEDYQLYTALNIIKGATVIH